MPPGSNILVVPWAPGGDAVPAQAVHLQGIVAPLCTRHVQASLPSKSAHPGGELGDVTSYFALQIGVKLVPNNMLRLSLAAAAAVAFAQVCAPLGRRP
jgi:hypothetical protein